ncbi:hypothetical protein NQ315_012043 [Exocentrus adspersus]|uniref:Double jelly roll-like domain-containing protein n=1 Tax=Exocentrus adspersus TaxID=1586481 RepID=A0AAV8VIR8_9CUCU|nr:hypothetical protein NQ315_012043 [Exocentrus adspersus]
MSNSFLLSGRSSTLIYKYSPPIILDDGKDYVLGLINFQSYNSIPNIEKNKNDKFYYGSEGEYIEIHEGNYDVNSINKYIQRSFGDFRALDDNDSTRTGIVKEQQKLISIKANNNTLKCKIKCSEDIDFTKKDSIGHMLGFKPRKLPIFINHQSDFPVDIFNVNNICVECNIVGGSYLMISKLTLFMNSFLKCLQGPITQTFTKVIVKMDILQVIVKMDILQVNAGIYFDDAVTSAEKHTHQAYASTSLNNNDEIRIPIQQQDLYTLPNESSLYIEDRIRNPGLTSIIKGYISFNKNAQFLQNSGWFLNNNEQSNIVDDNANFINVVIELSTIFGFCEDYRKIILNMRQELVLIRSNSDTNAIINSTENESLKVVLNKILWKMPHISVSDVERLKLVGYVARNMELEAAFRGWKLHEYPLLQETQRHTWNIKTATQLEKPRFVIAGFHTDHCSHQNESLKSGSVEIRLEFETNKDISPNTSCYALIIHDRLVKYNPLTSSVRILF